MELRNIFGTRPAILFSVALELLEFTCKKRSTVSIVVFVVVIMKSPFIFRHQS